MKIQTSHKWRQFVYRWDVPKRVLKSQFYYQDEDDVIDGFFKFLGTWYHLDQFMHCPTEFAVLGYDGYLNDSFSSGVLIKLSSDGEEFQVARFCS